jgi:hypothetical protein
MHKLVITCSSTVVEHSPHLAKVKGLSPASIADGTRRENGDKKVLYYWTWGQCCKNFFVRNLRIFVLS